MKNLLLTFVFAFIAISIYSQQMEVPFTLDDRDRLIKLEVEVRGLSLRIDNLDKKLSGRIDNLDKKLGSRIDDLDKKLGSRIDDLDKRLSGRIDDVNVRIDDVISRIDRLEDTFTNLFMWGFGINLTAIFGLFGFILYDRRTTIGPVKREHDKVLKVLREYGIKDETLREIMKKVALW